MTPLVQIIAGRIAQHGPMRLDDYMTLCLLHPQHGYYSTRDPFGASGDFTTAPEISQMFGEMVGLALAQAWLDQGSPARFTLAELGPGRGTLMADILRATRGVAGFHAAAQVFLVEASSHLRQVQTDTLAKVWTGPIAHLDRAEDLPAAPLFLVANEFFDALPIRQFQLAADGWAERMVTLDGDGQLAFALSPPIPLSRQGKPGDVYEVCPTALPVVGVIGDKIAAHGGAAVIIDYGTWDGQGDSFQALRGHQYENPLAHPGDADLTAHVDFAPLAAQALTSGANASLPVPQGPWLLSLGIATRAARLSQAGDVGANAALARLTGDDQMGQLFKAMAIWGPEAPPPPGFLPIRAKE
ncbi:MAG: methyltransferase [Paracoccus denitrificans]|nr:MAG: methyltransferase [Paracoccus denitrificans]PZO84383.1 MAG: methyltransferase [Paracoccus denitrificans]